MSNLSNSRRRRCRHVDWYTFPDAGINSCWECGLTFQTAGFTPPEIVYSAQPQPENSSLQDEETLQAIRRPSTHYFPPLNPNRQGEIRVLDLKPGEQNDRLRCHLKTVNLAFGVVYEAVSYTWADNSGNDDLCSTIYALGTQDRPGGDIAITRNCEAMLRRLRHPHKTRRLWVDAICIDQLNIRERNHQVQAMTAIFRGAQRVVVYLGEAEPVVDRLVEYITEDQGGHLPALLDFLPLFRTRWFHRVWVLQEIAVARSALLVLERRSLDWQELVINARVFLRLVNEQRQYIPLPPVLAFGLQSTSNGPSAANLTVDFLSIMRVSRDCSCKDPRDKIYAVLGLADTDSRPPLEADYSSNASPRPVYSRFAVWHVSRTLTPRILEHVEGLSRLAASAMPTWVPDWTNAGPQSPLPS
ncbi:heterokaryon incompatibility protein-domain-containing protein, partial [Podospora aff. communis PSN243]